MPASESAIYQPPSYFAVVPIFKGRDQAICPHLDIKVLYMRLYHALLCTRAHFPRRLKRLHGMDIMTVPSWITEDTVNTLGRESKFLRFNILPCPINGPMQPLLAV